MRILLTLAWRNLWRNKRRTLITVSSVLFAYVLATALLSFAKGFQQQMTETLIRQETGYLQIQDALYFDEPSLDHTLAYEEEVKEALAALDDEISYVVPRISGFSLAAKEMSTRPAMVTGILPEQENKIRNLSGNMVSGEMFGADDDYAVIASGLADMLELGIGDTLILIGQGYQALTATGMFKVGGIIEFQLPEQNNTAVFLPLKKAQWYFAADNRLTNLIIMPADTDRIDYLAGALRNRLDDEWYTAKTWRELMPDMVGLMEMQDTVYTGITWIFYVIVGFGIFGTILTMLYERMQEFGILLSIGMKRFQLGLIAFIETILIGLLGIAGGILAALPIVYFFQIFPVEFTGEMADYILRFGMEPVFPFLIDKQIFFNQAYTVFGITLLIGLYTMRKIYAVNILEAAQN